MAYIPIEDFKQQYNINGAKNAGLPYGSGPGSSSQTQSAMGAKAYSPQDNVAKPTYPIKNPYPGLVGKLGNLSQTGAPNSEYAQNYLIDSANQPSPAKTGVQGLYGFMQSPSPEVKSAQDDYNKFAQSAPYMQAAQYNPNVAADIAGGRSALLGQTFGQVLGAKAQAVSNAYTGQSQQISAGQAAGNLGLAGQAQQFGAVQSAADLANTGRQQALTGLSQAAGLSTPTQVSPGNFYVSPVSGQDVSGGDINPFTGGRRQTQVQQGAQYQANAPLIDTAAGYVNEFNNLLGSSGLLSSDVNVQNLLKNIYASNTSNPAYPKIQSLFNNAMNNYSQVLGQSPDALVSSISATGKASTLSDLFRSLDAQARSAQENLGNSGQNVNAPSTTINAPGGNTGGMMFGSFFN